MTVLALGIISVIVIVIVLGGASELLRRAQPGRSVPDAHGGVDDGLEDLYQGTVDQGPEKHIHGPLAELVGGLAAASPTVVPPVDQQRAVEGDGLITWRPEPGRSLFLKRSPARHALAPASTRVSSEGRT